MKEQPKAAIYARVSTNNGQNPEMQIKEVTAYCGNRGWNIAGKYIDRGFSGAADSRPELNRLMKDAHQRRIDVVVVWKFDRFARSVSHLLRALEEFRSLGIEFVSLSEQVDTSTPAGKMVFTVLGAVAELERSLIGERVKAGLRNARANGSRLGRPSKKDLSDLEIKKVKRDRVTGRFSLRRLAAKYGTSLWAMQQIAGGQTAHE